MQFRTTLKSAFVVVLCAAMMPLAAMARPAAQTDKLESVLFQTLAGGRPSDLIVHFAPQADLSAAYRMDWESRGKYVVEALQAAAAQSQAPSIAYLDRQGLRTHTFLAGNELYVWQASLDAALGLAALADVAHIRAPIVYSLDPIVTETIKLTTTTDWGISDSKADQFWTTFGKQGDGIVVANIDTGVQWDHPGLVGQYKCPANPGSAECWLDPENVCGGTPCDNVGHGTHTMGTMVAADDPNLPYIAGMAPGAQWIACKGCASSFCSGYDLGLCADWILAPGGNPNNRPQVVNCSWGGTGGNDWAIPKVQAWRAAGIFPAFAAGNSGPVCDTLYSPADYQESFASAAHSSTRVIAGYSSRGAGAFGQVPHTKPNISAPGSSICSTIPGSTWSCSYGGTSMASPHTAGAVALLWSCNASLRGQVEQTFALLQGSADFPPGDDCGGPGEGNCTYGYGFLNVLAAGQASCGTQPPPAPIAPTSLSATAVSDVEIDLTWSDNAGDEDGFTIERSLDQATWTSVGGVGANVTTYSDTGLAANTSYYYRVYAHNQAGNSGYSNQAGAITYPPVPSMHVDSITLTPLSSRGKDSLTGTVSIKDQNGNPISGASVSVQWAYPPNKVKNESAKTKTSGVATFTISAGSGTYRLCVTNVTKAGWTYVPGQNVITCREIAVR